MKKRTWSTPLAALALAAGIAGLSSSASAEQPSTSPVGPQGGWPVRYNVVNVHSGKCLEIAFEGLWDFNAANQYTCTGRANQRWNLISLGQ